MIDRPGESGNLGSGDSAVTRREVTQSHEDEIANLRRMLAARDDEIAAMQGSSSWRLTAPLRRLALRLRRLRIFGKQVTSGRIDTDAYRAWIESYSCIDAATRARLLSTIDEFKWRPRISVLMPSYNIDPKIVEEAIESVRRQIYPFWELCISDDASTIEGLRELLQSAAASDPRIRVSFRESTGNISVNSNAALDLATGDYLALLDADDMLPEDALYWVAREISLHPEADLIFTDEDKLDAGGRRFDPHFKTAWNAALMLSQNAFSHLGVFRRSLVENVGRFRSGYEGAQDLDLVLRCSEATDPDRIRHIPRVLYHWRASAGSTAAGLAAKPHAWLAGQRAIADHLARRGVAANVAPACGSYYQVNYDLPQPAPLVSIILPTAASNPTSIACIGQLLAQTSYRPFELLLLVEQHDAAAARQDARFAEILADPRVRLLTHAVSPFNYSAVNNAGVAASQGSLLCFVNDDVEPINADWLTQLVARASLPGVGGVGPLLYYPSGQIQHAGVLLGIGGVADHAFRNMDSGDVGYFARGALEQDYSCLTAACLLLRREAFEAAGRFDPALPIAFNDVDLCIRVRKAGFRLIWTPTARLRHHESMTLGAPDKPQRRTQFQADFRLMRERWNDVLDADPYYNPNLSLDPGRQFQLADPPRAPFAVDSGISRVPTSKAP